MSMIHLSPGNPSFKHPVEPARARLATWSERTTDTLVKPFEAVNTTWCALRHGHGKDHALARLEDTCRTLGVAVIAGLGSLGISQTGGSLPLVLGGLSWLGAMAITPQIINAMVWLKTGVSLGVRYKSSNDEIRPLFQDPNYMPMQVLPLQKRIQLADRFKLPKPHPDRASLLEARLKQVMTQAHTWWMLMAGMATPVLAATICDRIEDPVKNMVSRAWPVYLQRMVVKPALQSQDTKVMGQALERVATAVIGSGTDMTASARWWQQLPGPILKALKLDTLPQNVLLNPSANARFEAITAHLARVLPSLSVQDALQTTLHVQRQALTETLSPLESLLNHPLIKSRTTPTTVTKVSQQAQLARETAEATLNHLDELVKAPWERMNYGQRVAHVRQNLEKRILPYVEQLNRTGYVSRVRQMAGGSTFFSRVMSSFGGSRFAPAFSQMGDSPKSFLGNAVRSLGLRRNWVKGYPGLIGGGMLVATAVFIAAFLGKDFGPAPAAEAKSRPGGRTTA